MHSHLQEIYRRLRLRPGRPLVSALFLLSVLLGATLLAACGGTGTAATSTPTEAAAPGLPRGKMVFARYCNSCHPGGRGSGPSLVEAVPKLSDEQLRTIVRNGQKQMPAYGPTAINDEELNDLVTYMRSLKQP